MIFPLAASAGVPPASSPSKRPRAALLLLLLALLAACGPSAEQWRARLEPTPRPQLAEPDPAFIERIATLEGGVEAALSENDVDPAKLAEAQAELGFFYLAYLEIDAARPAFRNAAAVAPADWRWPYLLGFIAQMRGELPDAAPFFEKAAQLAPQEAGPLLRLAETRIDQGQPEAAAAPLAALRKLQPELPAALFQEARRLDRSGDAAAVAPLLEKVLAAQPGAGTARYLLGQAYRKLGREEDARKMLAAAGEARVQFADPLLARLDDLGVSEGFYRLRAGRAFEARDYPAAAAAFRKVLALGPGRFGDQQRLAYALYLQGDKSGALSALNAARARPDAAAAPAGERAEAHRLAALLRMGQGDRAAAVAELRQGVAAVPDLPAGHEALRLMLADALEKGGDTAGALAVYGDWLAREPQSARAALERGQLRLQQGDRGGLADVRRAAELAPGDAILQRRCGELLEKVGELAAARRSYAAAVRDAAPPRSGDEALSRGLAYAHLANLERQDGRLAEAEKLYRQGLALLPARDLRLNLADLLLARGAYAEAAELYAAARGQEPKDAEVRHSEAAALILLGRFGDARKALEDGVAALPEDLELRHLLARLLAIAPQAADRDGARALQLALAVVQAKATSQHAETLAMALAENGRFPEAAGLLGELLAEGKKRQGNVPLAYWQSQLDGYRQNRPFRADPPGRFFRPRS